jgi:hypothetical protein
VRYLEYRWWMEPLINLLAVALYIFGNVYIFVPACPAARDSHSRAVGVCVRPTTHLLWRLESRIRAQTCASRSPSAVSTTRCSMARRR